MPALWITRVHRGPRNVRALGSRPESLWGRLAAWLEPLGGVARRCEGRGPGGGGAASEGTTRAAQRQARHAARDGSATRPARRGATPRPPRRAGAVGGATRSSKQNASEALVRFAARAK